MKPKPETQFVDSRSEVDVGLSGLSRDMRDVGAVGMAAVSGLGFVVLYCNFTS